MKKQIIQIVISLAKPFMGKGLVDKYAPFLIAWFETLYSALQSESLKKVRIPLGLRLYVSSKDTGIGLPLILKGDYEPLETNLFLETVSQGDTVIDIGANIGYYTVLAAKKIGRKGKVYAFEADSENSALLEKNTDLNSCHNVLIEKKAVTDKNRIVSFTPQKRNKGGSSLSVKKGSHDYSVPGITLDSYLEKKKIKRVDVLKMDIEGAEVLVLNGAKKLSRFKNTKLFIEYNPKKSVEYSKNPKKLIKQLESLNFKIVSIIDETRGEVLPYSPKILQNVLLHTTYCNLYCIKE